MEKLHLTKLLKASALILGVLAPGVAYFWISDGDQERAILVRLAIFYGFLFVAVVFRRFGNRR